MRHYICLCSVGIVLHLSAWLDYYDDLHLAVVLITMRHYICLRSVGIVLHLSAWLDYYDDLHLAASQGLIFSHGTSSSQCFSVREEKRKLWVMEEDNNEKRKKLQIEHEGEDEQFVTAEEGSSGEQCTDRSSLNYFKDWDHANLMYLIQRSEQQGYVITQPWSRQQQDN